MDRRAFLATGAVGIAGFAGCLGDGDDGGDSTGGMNGDGSDSSGGTNGDGGSDSMGPDLSAAVDPDPSVTTDGLAPEPNPEAVSDIDPTAPEDFGTYEHAGYEVPLVPIETARYWYHNEQARFIDARGQSQYESLHVKGAVSSPADADLSVGGVDQWGQDERIVTYCRCPHTLASMRATNLYDGGYQAVAAIDEGFGPWIENGYPTAPEGDDSDLSVTWDVAGYTDPSDAGDYAWVRHDPTGQREVSRIGADGAFSMTLHFVDVDQGSQLALETPSAELVAPARELVGETIDLTG